MSETNIQVQPQRFSVVVVLHNHFAHVRSHLDEVLRLLNSHTGYELIVVDDGSTDGTAEAVQAYSSQDIETVRYVLQRPHLGMSGALRTGARLACTDRLVFLDPDRLPAVEDLNHLINHACNAMSHDARVAFVTGNRRFAAGSMIQRYRNMFDYLLCKHFLQGGPENPRCRIKVTSRRYFLDLPFLNGMHELLPALYRGQGLKVLSEPLCGPDDLSRSRIRLIDLLAARWLQKRINPASESEYLMSDTGLVDEFVRCPSGSQTTPADSITSE